MAQLTGHRTLHGDNPFGADPAADLLQDVRSDIAHWSETMYFHVWNPIDEIGIFIHVGRWPTDLNLWWGQVIAMLPDGELLADRSWGRAPDRRGPATGNLRIECVEPLRRWRLTFDGAGEPTTIASMAERAVGSARAKAFRFTADLTAIAPVWDMHAAFGIEGLSWAIAHHVQGFTATGTLISEGRTFSLDGVAHRDHSSGPRNYADFGGLHFFTLVFPEVGRVANGLVNWKRDEKVDHRVYTIQQDGICEIGTELTCTGLEDLATHAPQDISLTLTRSDGTQERYAAQRRHGYTLTLLEPNENVNGADHDGDPDPLFVTQSTVRVVAPDGQVGYGVIERDYRRSLLPSPEER